MSAAEEHGQPENSSGPHVRTRRDHAAETAEDYVEAVAELIDTHGACRVKDLSERFGVTHVTVIGNLQRLEREGLVVTRPYRPVELTRAGRCLADRCKSRHELVVRFLLAIGVPPEVALLDAEGIEHHLSPATLERFRAIADGDPPVR
ncbi:MAG: manganese-binding transcriptional regulator MntR [Planctomycetota bacterium]